MEPGERERDAASLVHMVFLASIGVYALVLWITRGGGGAPSEPTGKTESLAAVFMVIGAAECFGADRLGRRRLSRGGGDPISRVRSFFLVRFGAAESAAVFGLMLGFLGGGVLAVGLLFALSATALLLAAPSREAWGKALALARSEQR
jgi:hypothetical protein